MKGKIQKEIAINVAIIIGTLVILAPFVWMLLTSLKLPWDIFTYPPKLLPQTPTLSNYAEVWRKVHFFTYFKNSTIVVSIVTISSVILGGSAGFALGKYKFPGQKIIFILIISTLMIPAQITIIPLFLIASKLRVLDTYLGIALPDLSTAFGVFFMRQYVQSIPDELLDAARIDGSSEFYILWRIIFPLCKPALATTAIFVMFTTWNAFLWPLIVTNSVAMRTLPLGLSAFKNQFFIEYGPLMSACFLSMLPLLVIFIVAQKQVIRSIASTGLKG